MSIEAKKAAFKIKDYKFTDFSFNESFTEGELSIGFLPKGEYLESVGEYYLYFKFIAFKEDDNIPEELEEEMASLNITLKTTFVFDPIVPFS
ncbi:MAG: hypothetical protein IPH46_04980 [Bacteroidetes bacterium]|nr:hypothetical protein [Bacteroidota bacterium]